MGFLNDIKLKMGSGNYQQQLANSLAINPPQPVAQPVTPVKQSIYANQETTEPKDMKDMQSQFDDALLRKDMGIESPEEAQKRERQQAIGAGITGLGAGLSNLANLYYTTQWAPDQRLGNAGFEPYEQALQKSEAIRLNNWKRYLEAKRQIYARREEYKNQAELNRQRLAANYQDKELQRQFQTDRDTRNNSVRLQIAADKANNDSKNNLDKENLRHNNRMEEIDREGQWRIKTKETSSGPTSKSGGGKSKSQTLVFTSGGGQQSREYDMKDPADIVQMYQDGVRAKVFKPEEVTDKYGVKIENPTANAYRNYIYSKLNQYKEADLDKIGMSRENKKVVEGFSSQPPRAKSNKKTVKGF